MLDRARDRFPWAKMQTVFPFSEEGIQADFAAYRDRFVRGR